MKQKIILNARPGFSLVEVVVAVGIFALAIVGVIGLIAPTNKAISEVHDTDDASRVVTAVQQGLQQMAQSGYFTTTGGNTGVGSSSTGSNNGFVQTTLPADPANGASIATNGNFNTFTLYASRDGSTLGLYNSSAWAGIDSSGVSYTNTSATANARKFFEIMLIRNTSLSPNNTAATADTAAGFIAYTMRIRWPAFVGNGTEFTAHTEKNVLLVPGAVSR